MIVQHNIPMPITTAIAVVNADGIYTFSGRLAGLYLFSEPGNPARVPLSLKQVRAWARDLLATGRVTLTVEGGIPRATKS